MSVALSPAVENPRSIKLIRLWLFVLAGLVFAMVVVGGATRMTGSGLSITEWKPVLGALPPLNEQDWQSEFEKYKAISQFSLLNAQMQLPEFKTIYWWEWSHRQLGRFIGVVFAAGYLGLLLGGHIRGVRALAYLGLGVLGGLQAFVGWIMVASGLKPGMTAVEPVRLMLHLTLAAMIFALLVTTATALKPRSERVAPAHAKMARLLLGLTLLQIALGALVAGNHAGLIYNTWPLMDGSFLPQVVFFDWQNKGAEAFFDGIAFVQFNHRLTAYILLALALLHAYQISRAYPGTSARKRAIINVWLLTAQAVIGIGTLVMMVPMHLALTHQAFAMLVLGMTAAHAAACRSR
jgi:cytochrome c oxidase assembly protein subunit 15